MHKIVITNISGGEGKTMITRELAFTLRDRGFRVAVVDTDPQASLTKTLGLHQNGENGEDPIGQDPGRTILSIFRKEDPERPPSPVHIQGIDVWPANDALLEIDNILAGDASKQVFLRMSIDQLEDDYDFILIDTKPGITHLLNVAVAAADHILVPVSGDKGMENLDKLTRLMRFGAVYSPNIAILMFIRNRSAHTNLSQIVQDDLKKYEDLAPVSHPIRESVSVGEASRMRLPLREWKPKSPVVKDLEKVTDQILAQLGVVNE